MPESEPQPRWRARFNDPDRDAQRQEISRLETENSHLKQLVVRLSETIIRNVNATR